jgi:hypothetical protein
VKPLLACPAAIRRHAHHLKLKKLLLHRVERVDARRDRIVPPAARMGIAILHLATGSHARSLSEHQRQEDGHRMSLPLCSR